MTARTCIASTKHVHPSFTRIAPHPDYAINAKSTVAMLDTEDFDAVFPGVTYTSGVVQQIQEFQHALGGRTFFERLLDLLKIKSKASRVDGMHGTHMCYRLQDLPSKRP